MTRNREAVTKAIDMAVAIESRILSEALPGGVLLGSETALAEEFGVSRPVAREAIHLLVEWGIATTRRGPGGGLTTRAPEGAAVLRAAQRYLSYRSVEKSQLIHVRIALEMACLEELVPKVTESGIARIRATLNEEAELGLDRLPGHADGFHETLADLTGNAALSLFIPLLMRLEGQSGIADEFPSTGGQIHHAHSAIAEAVVSGDLGLAQYRMRRHLAAILAAHRVASPDQPKPPSDSAGPLADSFPGTD
jgi:DNA-binding FadR family transcriptional regulator